MKLTHSCLLLLALVLYCEGSAFKLREFKALQHLQLRAQGGAENDPKPDEGGAEKCDCKDVCGPERPDCSTKENFMDKIEGILKGVQEVEKMAGDLSKVAKEGTLSETFEKFDQMVAAWDEEDPLKDAEYTWEYIHCLFTNDLGRAEDHTCNDTLKFVADPDSYSLPLDDYKAGLAEAIAGDGECFKVMYGLVEHAEKAVDIEEAALGRTEAVLILIEAQMKLEYLYWDGITFYYTVEAAKKYIADNEAAAPENPAERELKGANELRELRNLLSKLGRERRSARANVFNKLSGLSAHRYMRP